MNRGNFLITAAILLSTLGFPLNTRADNAIQLTENGANRDNLITALDQNLAACWDKKETCLDDSGEKAESLKKWFKSLSVREQKLVMETLSDRVMAASEQTGNAAFMKAAEEYLLLAAEDDSIRGELLDMLGQIYSDQQESDNLKRTIDRLNVYCSATGQDYTSSLVNMKRVHSQLVPLSKDLEGVWVSDLVGEGGFPQFIYRVKGGKVFLDPQSRAKSGIQYLPYRFQGNMLAQVFEVNDITNQVRFDFFSRKFRGAHTGLANSMYDLSLATGRAWAEYSAQKNVSFAQSMGAAVESAILGAIFESIGEEIAKSRSTVYWLSNYGQRIAPGVLSISSDLRTIKATVDGESSEDKSESFLLYHIDPGDDIPAFAGIEYYTGNNGAFYVLDGASKADVEEAKRAYQKSHSTGMVVGGSVLTVGAGVFVYGIIKKSTWTSILGGALPMVVGTAIVAGAWDSFVIPHVLKDYNGKQMDKLRAKYGVSLTSAPMYDPFTNSGGMTVAMTF